MPARDPATTPHFTSTSSPAHTHAHSTQVFSPTSSNFSARTHNQAASPPDSPLQAQSGYLSQVLRRVSRAGVEHMDEGRDEERAGGSSVHVRNRRDSWDASEDRSAPALSTSQAIRESSNRLASLSFTSSQPRQRRTSQSSHSASNSTSTDRELFNPSTSPLSRTAHPSGEYRPHHPSHLSQSLSNGDDISPPKGFVPGSVGNVGRSGLSMMLEREKHSATPWTKAETSDQPTTGTSPIPEATTEEERTTPLGLSPKIPSPSQVSEPGSGEATPMPRKASLADEEAAIGGSGDEDEDPNASSGLRRYLAAEVAREDASENTPLLGYGKKNGVTENVRGWKQWLGKLTVRDIVRECVEEPIKTIPATVLGLLLNVLDGVSYGMILFPANPVFEGFGSLGVSMFFMSCIVSQLVFSCGGSIFPGGNGSMMIEAVPFFHILVNTIQTIVGDDDRAIIATTMAAFAFSSILTGIVFFTLGAFKLGSLVGYFPRHILVGCIGGVGIFLIETGLEVSRGLKEEGFEYNFNTLKLFFNSPHSIILWTLPLALAIILRIITHFFHHQLIFPAYFFVIPIIFYIVVAIGGWEFDTLRAEGWVFDVGKNTQAWWKFYTYYDFSKTHWGAFWAAMPTQLALVFFGILHVPLNVPALGVSLSEDNVKLDRELVAHGFSNLAAGLTGTVPNYLTYVNTVLFYRVGGGSRLSGLMLTAATAAIMFVGPTVISYLPVMVVGALIFVLGIDLTIEAVWDTRNRVNRMEYITIWAIAIGMTVWDFVIGLLFGIILACIFFVVQNSRRRAIRTVFNGSTAKSTVRRPRSQRAFIQQVGSQTYVMKLQGFLFFGTISAVEAEIRKLLDLAKWQHNPIRFLIIDFALVHGLDFSSAEAFVRVQRLLAAKDVLLILCGAAPDGLVGTALRGVDLWADREGSRVEVFTDLNEALEWTENAYLTAFYENQRKAETSDVVRRIDFPKVDKPPFSLAESFQNSPRRSHLARAGDDTLPNSYRNRLDKLETSPEEDEDDDSASAAQPLALLNQTFGSYLSPSPSFNPSQFLKTLTPFFTQYPISPNQVIFTQNDPPDGLYLIERGSLRATYAYDDGRGLIQETMVAGTIAGDLSTLSETSRNCTVVSEGEGVLWKMDGEGLTRLEKEEGEVARLFIRVVLKAVAEEQDVLSSHLIAVLS